jgi:hypothetical protein
MRSALINVSVLVSVPDETSAGALAQDMRVAVEGAIADYYTRDLRVTLSCSEEHEHDRTERLRERQKETDDAS